MTKATLSCHIHPRYKAIRKPRPGCVLCHAMWQDRLVEIERKQKAMGPGNHALSGDTVASQGGPLQLRDDYVTGCLV